MKKYSYILYILSLIAINGCKTKERRLDKLALENWDKTFISKDVTYPMALKYLKKSNPTDIKKIHTINLFHTAKEEKPDRISNDDLALVSKELKNICFLRAGGIDYVSLKASYFKELRIYKGGIFDQNVINDLVKCKNLMRIDLRYQIGHAENDVKIDSFPKMISGLNKLKDLNLDYNTMGEQQRPDYLLEYSRDSSNKDHYNPNFKYDHPLDFIWLPEFPETFSELPLKTLRMSGNKANTFQSCVGDLKELEELVLVGHNFDSGLEHLARLKTLKRLQLDLGASSGHLPDDVFKNLKNLEELNITWEDLPRLPSSISQLKNLKVLKILYCNEIKEIPKEIEAIFPQLEYLKIRGCKNIPNKIIDKRN